MSVTLRLQRQGTRNKSFFHIVAADSRKPRNGRFIEKLGYYDPNTEPSVMVIKQDRAQYWFSKGASLSNTLKVILKKQKINLSRKTQA